MVEVIMRMIPSSTSPARLQYPRCNQVLLLSMQSSYTRLNVAGAMTGSEFPCNENYMLYTFLFHCLTTGTSHCSHNHVKGSVSKPNSQSRCMQTWVSIWSSKWWPWLSFYLTPYQPRDCSFYSTKFRSAYTGFGEPWPTETANTWWFLVNWPIA